MKRTQSARAFTIIEVLVYIGLFAIVIGGAVAAVYQIVESSGRSESKAQLQKEGDFLIGKIEWALSGARAFEMPGVNVSNADVLIVRRWDVANDPVAFALSGTDLTISRAGGAAVVLNNTNVAISDFRVSHLYAGGTNPESITATIDVLSRAPNGMPITATFTTTKYLRK
ncbi:MAG: prepilin-type N-terminal cleavage/methylation domain-containing protein [Patescibacteria group bacterium]